MVLKTFALKILFYAMINIDIILFKNIIFWPILISLGII